MDQTNMQQYANQDDRTVLCDSGFVPGRLGLVQAEKTVAGVGQHQLLQPFTQLLREVQQLHTHNRGSGSSYGTSTRMFSYAEHKSPRTCLFLHKTSSELLPVRNNRHFSSNQFHFTHTV